MRCLRLLAACLTLGSICTVGCLGESGSTTIPTNTFNSGNTTTSTPDVEEGAPAAASQESTPPETTQPEAPVTSEPLPGSEANSNATTE